MSKGKSSKRCDQGFPGGSVVKNPPANSGDSNSILVQEDPTFHRATKPVHQTTKLVL